MPARPQPGPPALWTPRARPPPGCPRQQQPRHRPRRHEAEGDGLRWRSARGPWCARRPVEAPPG
eukprot:7820725-Lingulodinium_polyedra.AAC.1